MLHFLKKIKKNNCRYHYQNLDDMIYMIYSSWDIEQNILILVILGNILPFYPHKNPKIKILKNKKICWRYHYFTHVYQKSQSYCVQLMRYRVKQAEFFVILDHFLPFYPLWTQKIKIVEKWTIHLKILSFYNDSYMIYSSWDVKCNRHNFLSFGLFFALLPPLTTRKMKIFKNWNIIILYTHVYHKWRSYDV